MLNKNPRFNNNPPFLRENFQILKTFLIITPPLVQKILLMILIFFHAFFFGMEPDDIPLPQTIGDYNSRCRSHQDDPLFLFDKFVKLQLELVTVISFYILKGEVRIDICKNIQNEDFAKVSSTYGLLWKTTKKKMNIS